MNSAVQSACQAGLFTLVLSLLSSCGGAGDPVGDGGPGRNFHSGTGFDHAVLHLAPALDASGDMYVAGGFTRYNGATANRLVRVHRDGSLDRGFDIGDGFDGDLGDIAPINDGTGDLYAAGEFVHFRGHPTARIARVKPDGTGASVDFGTGFDGSVYALALNDGGGDLYAGGDFTLFRQNARVSVARVNPDGSNDSGFATGSGFTGVASLVSDLAVTRDGTGRVYAGGLFSLFRGNARAGIVRINPDGANDASFDPGTGFNSNVISLAVASDGTNALYAVGIFTSYRGNSRSGIVRILPDGSDDGTFATGTGFDGAVYAVAEASDGSGDIYVGGAFHSYDGSSVSRIARLHHDGSLDAGFATGSGFDGYVAAIAPATDGSGDVLLGGDFTHFNGTAVGRIVRLNVDGSLD